MPCQKEIKAKAGSCSAGDLLRCASASLMVGMEITCPWCDEMAVGIDQGQQLVDKFGLMLGDITIRKPEADDMSGVDTKNLQGLFLLATSCGAKIWRCLIGIFSIRDCYHDGLHVTPSETRN